MSLVNRAEGTHPVSGQVFELGAGSDAVVRVTLRGVILIPAYIANILFHVFLFLKVNNSAAKIRLFSYMAKNILRKTMAVGFVPSGIQEHNKKYAYD